MKKLLVLALSVVMVLAFAAVSMAASTVTVSGAVVLEIQNNSTATTTTAVMNDIDNTNIKVSAKLNDDVTAQAQLDFGTFNVGANQVVPAWDATYLQVANFGPGTLQMGHTTFGTSGLDILSCATGMGTYDANYEFALGGGLKLKLADTVVTNGTNAVQLNYASDTLGGNIYYNTADKSYDVLVSYKMGAVKFQAVDGKNSTGGTAYGVEVIYTQDALGAFFEYDNCVGDKAQEDAQISYTMDNGFATIFRVINNDINTLERLEFKVAF